jgi:hypothetical protein
MCPELRWSSGKPLCSPVVATDALIHRPAGRGTLAFTVNVPSATLAATLRRPLASAVRVASPCNIRLSRRTYLLVTVAPCTCWICRTASWAAWIV